MSAGRLPHRDLAFGATASTWLTAKHWWRLVSYVQVSACLARIGIVGSAATMDVAGGSSPCP